MKGIICYKSLKGVYIKSSNDVDKALKYKDKFYPDVFNTLSIDIKDIDIFKVFECDDDKQLDLIKNGVIYLLQDKGIALNNNRTYKPKQYIDIINDVFNRVINNIELPKTDNSYTQIKYNILQSIEVKAGIKLTLLQATLISIILNFRDSGFYGGFKLLSNKTFSSIDDVKESMRFLCKNHIIECVKDAKGLNFKLNKNFFTIL